MHPPTQELQHRASTETGVHVTHWIVSCLALWILLDLGGRFMPVEWLHILPEHIATRRPPLHAPFIPNLSIHYDPWVGETAMKGNLTPTETRPAVQFSTDNLGFRLTPGVSARDKVDVLLTSGASFSYGGGLSDTETFSAVFRRETGLKTYNGGRFFWDLQTFDELDWLLARLGNRHPAVFLIYWEDLDFHRSQLDGLHWPTDRPGERVLGKIRYHQIRTAVQDAKRAFTAFWNISPLEVLSIRFYKALANGRILPNRYERSVEQRTLPDGRRLLLLDEETAQVLHPPGPAIVNQRADYFEYYKQSLTLRGCDMFVILLPNKYTLYGPALDRERDWSPLPYIDRLEDELVRRGIPVLNGLTVLRPFVAADLASGQLSFYREDHHWSPLGVRRISAAAARSFKPGASRGQGGNQRSAIQ
jgi:hypothetical protein